MNSPERNSRQRTRKAASTARQQLIPALVAAGACGLTAAPAAALQLGELEVQSALGQPLRASIAYALRPGEQLLGHCILLNPAMGFPGLDRAKVSVDGSRIYIHGTAPVKEPIAALSLSVDCAYTANLTREYLLMLDPAPLKNGSADEIRFAANERPPAAVAAGASAAAPAPRRAPGERPRNEPPIGPSTTYRVQPGDSLSAIAGRITDRPIGLWPAAEQIFAANPDAFIDGDMNLLKAGSTLIIPSFGAAAPLQVAAADTTATAPAEAPAPAVPDVYEEPQLDLPAEMAAEEPLLEQAPATGPGDAQLAADSAPQPAFPDTAAGEEPRPQDRTARDQTADLVPGDIFVSDETASPESAMTTVSNTNATGESGSTLSWLLLFGGAGALVGAALFLFGRRSRSLQTPPTEPADYEKPIADDAPTTKNRILSRVDFDVTDLAADTGAAALDADLAEGTGLSGTGEPAVEDAMFSSSYDVDDSFDAAAITVEEQAPRIVIPTAAVEEDMILEREVLPSDDDDGDDYDVSMILDATKHRFSDDDVTAKQLEAVAVDNEPELDDSEYTLSNALDYDILEQDYEDELTATQALNKKILEAAEELKARLGEDKDDTQSFPAASDTAEAAIDDEQSSAMESTAILESDACIEDANSQVRLKDESSLTSQQTTVLPTEDLVDEAADETEIFPFGALINDSEATDSDETAEMPEALGETPQAVPTLDDTNATTELTAEATAQLPSAENDETTEMSVESGVYRTKKAAS